MPNENMEDTAKKAGAAIREAARDPQGAVGQAARQAGERVKSAADYVRSRLPQSGIAGEAVERVTDGVKEAATRLQEEGFKGVIDDVVTIARRYPMQTLLVGLACGYFLSRIRRD